jgi:hypothetical protein
MSLLSSGGRSHAHTYDTQRKMRAGHRRRPRLAATAAAVTLDSLEYHSPALLLFLTHVYIVAAANYGPIRYF